MSAVASQELHEEVRRRLAEHDIRYTGGRQAVVRTLQRVEGPQSAADLHKRVRSIPLSSLYRSLMVLADVGILSKHHDSDGLARFELAEWLMGHHHHMVCTSCGRVEDIEPSSDVETAIRRLIDDLASSVDYQVEDHVLEVSGICPACSK